MSSYPVLLKRHSICALALVLLAGTILVSAVAGGYLAKASVYLTAVGLSVVFIDAVLARWPETVPAIRVRSPSLETFVALVCFFFAMWFLTLRFVLNQRPVSAAGRLTFIVFGLGSVMNLTLAAFIVARGYRPVDLGLRWRGWLPAIGTMLVFATLTLLFARSGMTLAEAYAESGSAWAMLWVGLTAAVPEEFFRFIWQTRVAAMLKSPSAGWLVASTVWAILHGPVFWSQSHSAWHAAIGVIDIIPLGLLWGYLTYRTGSMLPAMLLHLTNLWGLQNL